MSKVNADAIKPRDTGLDITLGATGDSTVISADSIDVNTVKDSGGNTLWTSDGSGNLSSINAGLKGSEVLILSQTASNSASISFTSDIDSTYNVYVFRFMEINPVSGARLLFQTSIDGGSNYNVTLTSTAFRSIHDEADTDSGLSYRTAGDQGNGTAYQWLTETIKNDADACGAGEMFLFNPSSTTYIKHFYSTGQILESSDYSQELFIGGYFNTTSALNAISFKMDTGNFDGKIKMYGMSTT